MCYYSIVVKEKKQATNRGSLLFSCQKVGEQYSVRKVDKYIEIICAAFSVLQFRR